MGASMSQRRCGIGVAAALVLLSTSAWAAMTHDAHVTHDQQAEMATPVHAQAGPVLQDKMSKAIEQIEREVQTKGPFQGAGAHAMQQGILLVAEDPDKVKVTQGARCPVTAPVRAYDITAINVEITVNRFGDFYPGDVIGVQKFNTNEANHDVTFINLLSYFIIPLLTKFYFFTVESSHPFLFEGYEMIFEIL